MKQKAKKYFVQLGINAKLEAFGRQCAKAVQKKPKFTLGAHPCHEVGENGRIAFRRSRIYDLRGNQYIRAGSNVPGTVHFGIQYELRPVNRYRIGSVEWERIVRRQM